MGVDIKSSGKRLLIDKENARMFAIIAATSFVVTFSLIACKALYTQSSYQLRVIRGKDKALKQLKDNNKNVKNLVASYKTFAEAPVNVIDGNPTGTSSRDGDNPKLVLDALPSKYDFPGLISSLEKVLKDGGYLIDGIGGIDDEIAQQSASSNKPAPVDMPLPIGITSNYAGVQSLLSTLEHSIRPFYISQMTINASDADLLKVTMTAKTFYQPEKVLKIGSEVVK